MRLAEHRIIAPFASMANSIFDDLTAQGFNLCQLLKSTGGKGCGRGIKFIFRQYTFVITRAKNRHRLTLLQTAQTCNV